MRVGRAEATALAHLLLAGGLDLGRIQGLLVGQDVSQRQRARQRVRLGERRRPAQSARRWPREICGTAAAGGDDSAGVGGSFERRPQPGARLRAARASPAGSPPERPGCPAQFVHPCLVACSFALTGSHHLARSAAVHARLLFRPSAASVCLLIRTGRSARRALQAVLAHGAN